MFVVPSDSLGTAPLAVSNIPTLANGNLTEVVMGYNGALTSTYSPSYVMFYTNNASGQQQVMNLVLTKAAGATSPAPSAQAVGAPFPTSSFICNTQSLLSNIAQPTSVVILFQLDTTSNSCSSTDTYTYGELAYGASATTAPTPVLQGAAITTSNWNNSSQIYSATGSLAGFIIQEGSNLLFYPGGNFGATPTTLVSGISGATLLIANATDSVHLWRITATSGSTAVYRITAAGAATSVYSYTATDNLYSSQSVKDVNYAYFVDAPTSGSPVIVQLPWSGTGSATYTPSGSGTVGLLGSNGTNLDYWENTQGPGVSGSVPGVLNSLPLTAFGNPSVTPTPVYQLASTSVGLLNSFVNTDSSGSSYAYLDPLDETVNPYNYTSVLTPFSSSASQVITPTALFPVVIDPVSLTGYIAPAAEMLELQGISDSSNGWGGAALVSVNSGTNVATPFTGISGQAYTFPAGYTAPYGDGFISLASTGADVGIGIVQLVPQGSSPEIVAFFNATTHQIVNYSSGQSNFFIWY